MPHYFSGKNKALIFRFGMLRGRAQFNSVLDVNLITLVGPTYTTFEIRISKFGLAVEQLQASVRPPHEKIPVRRLSSLSEHRRGKTFAARFDTLKSILLKLSSGVHSW